MSRKIALTSALLFLLMGLPVPANAQSGSRIPAADTVAVARGQMTIAIARFQQDLNIAAAKEGLRVAAATAPRYPAPCLALGAMFELEEKWAESSSWYAKAAARQPNSPASAEAKAGMDRVRRYAVMDRTPEGRQKRQFANHLRLARARLAAGNVKEAISAARAANKLDESRWEPFAVLGMAFANLNAFREAKQAFTLAVEKCPEEGTKGDLKGVLDALDKRQQSLTLAAQARKKLDEKSWAAAAADFEAAYQLDTEANDAWKYALTAAAAYQLAGNAEKAKELTEIVARSPAASGSDGDTIKKQVARLRTEKTK